MIYPHEFSALISDNNVSTKLNRSTDSPSSDTVFGDVVTAFGGDTASESSLMTSENMETSFDRFSENGIVSIRIFFVLLISDHKLSE